VVHCAQLNFLIICLGPVIKFKLIQSDFANIIDEIFFILEILISVTKVSNQNEKGLGGLPKCGPRSID
jgi:hypothetical protein